MLSAKPEEPPRSFFGKIRDAYIDGRYSKEEKRILRRKERDRLRRKKTFDRNTRKLVDGLSARLKRGPWRINTVLVGGGAILIVLCYRGGIGCDRDEKRENRKQKQ